MTSVIYLCLDKWVVTPKPSVKEFNLLLANHFFFVVQSLH